MKARFWRKNTAVSMLLALLMVPVPTGRLAWSQQDTDNDEEDEAPTPQQPPAPSPAAPQNAPAAPSQPPRQPQIAPRVRPGQPPAAGQPAPQPPVAAPERRLLPPPGAPRVTATGDTVSLNFNRADLVEVIHVLAQHLKITYTIDPDVKGTVTINSSEPLRREDLFPVFNEILRMNGAVAVKTGDNIYRIAPIEKGKGIARPLSDNREGGYAIQIIPIRFFSVAEMKRLLTPFLTPGGEVFDFPRGNFLMVVDLPSNVKRLTEIADMIDVQTFVGTRTEVYQPKVASADELAAELTKIMQSYAASSAQAEGFAAQFISIPRINQLMVIADSDSAWNYVRRWIERLDTIGEGPGRRIFIYPVENGKAPDLADVLTQVLGITGAGQRARGPTLEQLHRGTTGSTPQSTPGFGQRAPGFGSSGGGFSSGNPSMGTPLYPFIGAQAAGTQPPVAVTPPAGAAQPPRQQQPTRPGETTRPGGERPPEEQLRVVADTTTNTLIIYGTAQEFQNIRTILRDLDIPPRQVVLECLIAEVKLTDSNSLGFDYQVLAGIGKKGGFTDTFTVSKDSPFPIQFGGGTGIAALVGSNVVRGLITAIQTDNRSKILASPTVLATDGQPARIQVGDEVPVATGTIDTSAGTGVATSTAIQSRNTGKILTIIPQVNAKGQVNLQFKVEVSKQGGNVTVGNSSFPSFSTRDVETTAVVRDGETLFIGGIFAEDRDRGRSGVPYLMDIPVLGWFFRKTTDTLTERTELIIMITPRVIRNNQESLSVTDDFRRKLSTVAGEIERMRRGPAKDEPPPPKVVVPGEESRLTPRELPEGTRFSRTSQLSTDSAADDPTISDNTAADKPGAVKNIARFLTFGIVK